MCWLKYVCAFVLAVGGVGAAFAEALPGTPLQEGQRGGLVSALAGGAVGQSENVNPTCRGANQDRFAGTNSAAAVEKPEQRKQEAELLSRYARQAFKVEVKEKGGWTAPRRCGDSVTFTVSFRPAPSNTVGLVQGLTAKLTLDNFGTKKYLEKEIPFVTGVETEVSGTLDEPGFLRLTISIPGLNPNFGGPWQRAVSFEPDRLSVSAPCPTDFDAFWSARRQACAAIPLDPTCEFLEKKSEKDKTHDHYAVSFRTLGDRRVYGYLQLPKDKALAPYALRVQVPGAGMGGWTLWPHAPKDEALLFMTVFPWAPSDDMCAQQEKYKKFLEEIREKRGYSHYYLAGAEESPEAVFYGPVILGIDRAVDWAAARDDIDANRVVYYGISQGGGFGLYLAGLKNASIRRYAVNVPAFADILCGEKGHQSCVAREILKFNAPASVERAKRNSGYFDTANFAARVEAPIRFVTGLSDWVCPPHTVYAAFNGCPSKDKAILLNTGDHNSAPEAELGRLNAWLKATD